MSILSLKLNQKFSTISYWILLACFIIKHMKAFILFLNYFILSVSSHCQAPFPQCCPEGMVYDMKTCRPILGASITKLTDLELQQSKINCPPPAVNIPHCINESAKLVSFAGETEYSQIYDGIYATRITLEDSGEERLSYFNNHRQTYFPAFCFHESLKGKALICPSTQLERAQIKKCCPFGEKLGLPLFEGCFKSDSNFEWNIRVNGYKKVLKDLIKFPYENVIHKGSEFLKILQSNSCDLEQVRAFDIEAFEINMKGDLVFANGKAVDISNDGYCVDSVQDPSVAIDQQLMVVLYCSSNKKVTKIANSEFKDFLNVKSGAITRSFSLIWMSTFLLAFHA
nr:uncharacterized protein LOC121120661 isoform X1 [Lepeophtheirus salmonis]